MGAYDSGLGSFITLPLCLCVSVGVGVGCVCLLRLCEESEALPVRYCIPHYLCVCICAVIAGLVEA